MTSTPKRRGLGRGLDALLDSARPSSTETASSTGATHPDDPAPSVTEVNQIASATENFIPTPTIGQSTKVLIELDPHLISINPEQPRHNFDADELENLAESLRLHGMLQPLILETEGQGYRLIAGERRLRAAKLAGLSTVPALIRPATESARQALELALTENLLREDLTPIEEARAYQRLADTFGLSHEAIAIRVGRRTKAISAMIRLLTLAPEVQQLLDQRSLTPAQARPLLNLPDQAKQAHLAHKVASEGLTARQTEETVRSHDPHQTITKVIADQISKQEASRRQRTISPEDAALERALERVLGTPVQLQRRRQGGRLTIDFFSEEELGALYQRLGGQPL